jgi:hypothetical protein
MGISKNPVHHHRVRVSVSASDYTATPRSKANDPAMNMAGTLLGLMATAAPDFVALAAAVDVCAATVEDGDSFVLVLVLVLLIVVSEVVDEPTE